MAKKTDKMAKNTDKKTFYSVEVEVLDGSQFDADGDIQHYGDILDAEEAFDVAVHNMQYQFGLGYDSDEILIYEDQLIDGTRICTIEGKNLADGTDTCKVKLRKLTMN